MAILLTFEPLLASPTFAHCAFMGPFMGPNWTLDEWAHVYIRKTFHSTISVGLLRLDPIINQVTHKHNEGVQYKTACIELAFACTILQFVLVIYLCRCVYYKLDNTTESIVCMYTTGWIVLQA